MISRDEAVGYAHGWASRADQHATDFRDLGYTAAVTEPKRAAHYGALRDQAQQMALMWATIAQLHDAGVCGARGGKFSIATDQDPTCVLAPHAADSWHQAHDGTRWRAHDGIRACGQRSVHDAHMWTADGQEFGCIGFPEVKLCHSRYEHTTLAGVVNRARCARDPHHPGLHQGDGYTWPTSQATAETQYFRCGYCDCAENPLRCGCDHEEAAVPHRQASVAPS